MTRTFTEAELADQLHRRAQNSAGPFSADRVLDRLRASHPLPYEPRRPTLRVSLASAAAFVALVLVGVQLSGVLTRPVTVATSQAPTTAPAAATPDRSPGAIDCERTSDVYATDRVIDGTGLIVSCTSYHRGVTRHDRGRVYNVPGNDRILVVEWLDGTCPVHATTTLSRQAGGGLAVSTSPARNQCLGGISGSVIVRGVILHLAAPVSLSDIDSVDDEPLPAPDPLPPLSNFGQDVEGDFTLELRSRSRRTIYMAGEPIADIQAAVKYGGVQNQVSVTGGHWLIQPWLLEQLDGPFDPDTAVPESCGTFTFESNSSVVDWFRKQGGFESSDPLSVLGYDAEVELRLPPGTWRITAASELFSSASCSGPSVSLSASIVIRTVDPTTVTPPPAPTVSPPTAVLRCTAERVAGSATVLDTTDLVDSCAVVTTNEASEELTVENLPGDPTVLRVFWLGSVCDKPYEFTLARAGDGFTLDGRIGPAGCFAMAPIPLEIRLHMRSAVDAASVTTTMTHVSPTPAPIDPCPWPISGEAPEGFDPTNTRGFCRSGAAVPTDTLSFLPQGPSHCGWQSVAFLHAGRTLGSPFEASTMVQYVRDPDGLLAEFGVPPLLTLDALPPLAGGTGLTNGNITLYWVDDLDAAIYAVMGSVIERWPRAPEVIACR